MCLVCGRRIRSAEESRIPGDKSVASSPNEFLCFRCYYSNIHLKPTPAAPVATIAVDKSCRHGRSCIFGIDLWRKYKISCWDYYNLLDLQGGKCKICGRSEDEFARRLHVDHDHNCCPGNRSCGMCVRGLLCPNCNIGLGKVMDDLTIIQSMIEYLEVDTPSESVI